MRDVGDRPALELLEKEGEGVDNLQTTRLGDFFLCIGHQYINVVIRDQTKYVMSMVMTW